MFTIVKRYKRMHIINDLGESVYSPPNFILMQNRKMLQEVADKFNENGSYDISAIIEFESDIRNRRDYRKKMRFFDETNETSYK